MRRLPILAPLLFLLLACHGESPTAPLESNAVITGRVTYAENGVPVLGARVWAAMSMGPGADDQVTDANGNYTLHLIGGTYVVEVFAPGATAPSFVELFVVRLGQETKNFAISSLGCVTVSGRVLDGVTYAGISGATITFEGQRVVSEGDGTYELQLGCGRTTRTTSTIVIEHPAYQRREYVTDAPLYSTRRDIYLQPK